MRTWQGWRTFHLLDPHWALLGATGPTPPHLQLHPHPPPYPQHPVPVFIRVFVINIIILTTNVPTTNPALLQLV